MPFLLQAFNEFKLVDLFNREGSRPPFNPVRVSELTQGRKYQVVGLRTINTKYGVKPICDLDTGESIYLPSKYCKALPKDDYNYHHFNIEPKSTTLVFLGHEKDKWRTPILKFISGNSTLNDDDDLSTCTISREQQQQ